MAVVGGAGAVVHRVQPVPGREEHSPAGAGGVGFGGEVLAVVGQGGKPDSAFGQVGRDRDPGGFEFAAQPLVRGGLGAVLADPLGDVFDGVPVAQGSHDLLNCGWIAVEFGQQG